MSGGEAPPPGKWEWTLNWDPVVYDEVNAAPLTAPTKAELDAATEEADEKKAREAFAAGAHDGTVMKSENLQEALAAAPICRYAGVFLRS